MSGLYQIFLAGMNPPNRPIGTMLFLGPTGSGKTRVIEAAAEVLYGDSNAIVKIDCAEFQHSHEIAKLIGSPPGYLGHRETSPMLTQENLDRMHTDDMKISLVLFDEIEKASDSLWQLLLGILDKATLTLGDNRRVDFSHAMVIMTSNLGAREMSELISGGIGFAPGKGAKHPDNDVDQKIYRTAVEAARRKFSPEFMNRSPPPDSRSRIAGSPGSHHAIGRHEVRFPVLGYCQGYALAGRPGFQIRRPPLETSSGTFSRLPALKPGGYWSDWLGRSRTRRRRQHQQEINLL